MRAYLIPAAFALAMLFAPDARPDSIARSGADWVRITAKPCSDAVMVTLITAAGEDAKDYRAASAEVAGVPYVACWRPVFNQRHVHLRYADGDQGMVPFDHLKPIPEV